MMQLRFEPDLDFQIRAVEAICGLFRGQEAGGSKFSVTGLTGQPALFSEMSLGVGNLRLLPDDDLHANLKQVQAANEIAPSEALESRNFTIEMETGTGKTYVYLRTIFELNRRYGFTKFVIVVPSVAIKEGVYKALQMTEAHFRSLYSGVPFDYFLYDSTRLGQVRNFAFSPEIQIMVVTVGAINKKDINNLYKESERTGGERPIDLVRATRPVVIVDEPQSVDGGLQGRGKEALERMEPLCTLRYSATHAHEHHMVYRLDAVDAYERKLVKQIEVASATVADAHNQPYVRVIEATNRGGVIYAKVEIDVDDRGRVRRVYRKVQDGDDLEETTSRPLYHNYRIGEISVKKGQEFVELQTPEDVEWLRIGDARGDVDRESLHRGMIRRTIREHLDKERQLGPRKIKVLSLFFVDSVEKYRQYDSAGNVVKGPYARIFEEEYRKLMRHPNYRTLFDERATPPDAGEVHDGYFSIDRKRRWTDTAEGNQAGREAAGRAYSLIMKDKEKLLSPETALKFIFSHSALREGWDNPNVFQICALREMHTERERRQTIGRGLRLCVDQHGERVRAAGVNTLTVIAGERYEDFAENLQREIERDTGIRFGIIERNQFAAIPVGDSADTRGNLGIDGSTVIWERLREDGHIDAVGRIRASLRNALRDDTLALPDAAAGARSRILAALTKIAGGLAIRNADERQIVKPRRAVLDDPDFRNLWDRVKRKTKYRVRFDRDRLVAECAGAFAEEPPIPKARLLWSTASVALTRSGVSADEKERGTAETMDEMNAELPDLLTLLLDRTNLTRRSIARILFESGRIADFGRNPQRFVEAADRAINRAKRLALVDGVKYERLGSTEYYAQERFETEELTGYLKETLEVQKSAYERVVYDSENEARFARELERTAEVKVYAKLPKWFTVPTPLGSYNPDWAILFVRDGMERLYLVVETKAKTHDLRSGEAGKIKCAKRHFEAIRTGESPAQYAVATTVEELLARLGT